jgi:hypothetical protein
MRLTAAAWTSNQHLVGTQVRLRHVAHAQGTTLAVSIHDEGFHGFFLV